MLMLQRCSEVKENKERGKDPGFNELKANWETKERNQIPENEWWGKGGSGAKGGVKGQQIRPRAICFVLYIIGETSVSLEARWGKADHERQKIQSTEIPQTHPTPCLSSMVRGCLQTCISHRSAPQTGSKYLWDPISKPSLDINRLS